MAKKSELEYYTVKVVFDSKDHRGEAERSERMFEGRFESEVHAIDSYKPQFYKNEPTLVEGSEIFTAQKGQHLTGAKSKSEAKRLKTQKGK